MVEGDHHDELRSEAPSPEAHAAGSQTALRIAAALGGLPERQRAVFVLRHYEERSLEEIAELLGMRLGTVKSSLHRAIHEMRRRLAGLRA
jgi:RNA polymerase sigma-70 factor (ECF subfamily)